MPPAALAAGAAGGIIGGGVWTSNLEMPGFSPSPWLAIGSRLCYGACGSDSFAITNPDISRAMPKPQRRPLIAGNWKMNGRQADGVVLASELARRRRRACESVFDLVVCPPATLLLPVAAAIADSP